MSSALSSFQYFRRACGLLACLAVAPPVFAIEIGCAGSNRNPAACSLAECVARQTVVNSLKSQPRSCRGVVGCANLRARRAINVQLIAARNSVSACFFVPEPGHQTAIADAQNAIARCDRKIALPEPEGCADPCP